MMLYFARHGESQANVLNVISNRGLQHRLTPRGQEQAITLAVKLREATIIKIYSSPLLRAQETAEIISRELEVPVETTGSLAEFDCGVLEGKGDAASWKLLDAVIQDWVMRGNLDKRIEGGESFLDVRARFSPFVEEMAREKQPLDKGYLLVGHGGLFRCMLPLVLTNIGMKFANEHPIKNGGLIIACTGPKGLVCMDWCGVRP